MTTPVFRIISKNPFIGGPRIDIDIPLVPGLRLRHYLDSRKLIPVYLRNRSVLDSTGQKVRLSYIPQENDVIRIGVGA